MFSLVSPVGGSTLKIMRLAPVAVYSEFQKQGIGHELFIN